ncbi:MAG: methionine--tRNA ligase [Candidatus Pacearchaeota archaeon]|jgi:methionyl-tRNA synthetase
MVKKKFYVTTAIDYVNAAPHIGHAFEKVIADTLVRWRKLKGDETWFLTGTDENAQTNVKAAKEKGIETQKFVDENHKLFVSLCKKLNVDYNRFIRTTEFEHKKFSQDIFRKVFDKGEIYKGKYEGYYCVGCEAFITEKDLVDGKCPDHNLKPEFISEDSYFFKLSKYKNKLIKFIEGYIVPNAKKNEILSRLKNEELKNLCVARKNLDWGIDNPLDKNFKIYVWFDALINYYSGAEGNWPADVHVVGKGINWFHSVIWPAMLMSAEMKLPKKLLVHGYINFGGSKMSKSKGNVVNPIELVEKYGSDSVRYFLLKCPVFDDSDYSEESLINRHNNELADKLGNLVSRTATLIEKNGLKKTENKLLKKLNVKKIEKLFENYEFDKVLNEIFGFVDVCNEYIQNKKPWENSCKDKSKILFEIADSIKAIAILLWPFIPETSEKIAKQFKFKVGENSLNEIKKLLSEKNKIIKGEILFKKVEVKEDKIENNQKANKVENIEGIMTMDGIVEFNEWEKINLRVAEIKKVEEIEGADKLWKLTLDVGKEIGQRIVCAGIKEHYPKDKLKGKKLIYFSNLKPRVMRGIESSGMILAAVSEDHKKVILISPEKDIENGSRVS